MEREWGNEKKRAGEKEREGLKSLIYTISTVF